MLEHEPLTSEIIGAAIEVHRVLGPGLLESTYELCLNDELETRRLNVRRQVSLPVEYKGRRLDAGYRVDLIINDLVIVEIKAAETVAPIHEAQLLTYMKLAGLPIGLLINFHVKVLKDGVKRRVLSEFLPTSPSALSASPR